MFVENMEMSELLRFGTFGTMVAARAAVKDTGKALGIPFSEMNLLASYIPSRPGTKLADALQESIEFKQAYDEDQRYKKLSIKRLNLREPYVSSSSCLCGYYRARTDYQLLCAPTSPKRCSNDRNTTFSVPN